MRTRTILPLLATVLSGLCASHAELQNVEIGGKIEIYGAWYSEVF